MVKVNEGYLIKEFREEAGLNRRQLSILSGVPYSTIRKIEECNCSATVATLEKILGALGYEIIFMKNENLGLQN